MLLTETAAYASELFLYFITIGYLFVPGPLEWAKLFALSCVLIAKIGLRIVSQKSHPKVLTALPVVTLFASFVPFMIHPGPGLFLLPLVPVIFVLVRFLKNAWGAEKSRMVAMLGGGSLFYLVMYFFYYAAGSISFGKDTRILLILFLTAGIWSIRMLGAQGLAGDRSFQLLNFLPLLLIAVLGLVLTSGSVLQAGEALGNILYRYVIVPVLMCVVLVIAVIPLLIGYGIVLLIKLIRPDGYGSELENLVLDAMGTVESAAGISSGDGTWPVRILTGAAILTVVILSAAVARRIVSLQSEGTKYGYERHYGRADAGEKKKEEKSRKQDHDPVREIYRKYLRFCRKKGLPADGEIASDELLKQGGSFDDPESAKALRDLWMPVRYGMQSGSDEAARQAKRLLKNLTGNHS